MPADGAYNHIRYINPDVVLLLCVPSLAFQRSSRSDLAPNPIDRSAWLRPFVAGARKIKNQLPRYLDKLKPSR